MKIFEIQVTKTKKLGLPNYSSVAASCGVKVSIEEGEDIFEAGRIARQEVQKQLDDELEPYAKENPKSAFTGNDQPEPEWIRRVREK